MITTFIYALKDPTDNKVRYIGKANDPHKRYGDHLNSGRDKNTHKRNWINKLKKENLRPILEILIEVPIEDWKKYEKEYIRKYIKDGCDLVNYTEGGEGLSFGNLTSFKSGHGSKKIVMLSRNGNYIKTFNSISEASTKINKSGSLINKVLAKRKKTCNNCIFIYEKDYLKMTDIDIKNIVELAKPKPPSSNIGSYKEREIFQYDLNKNFIRKWKSLSEASKNLNIYTEGICLCAKMKYKSAGGFFWSYKKIE